MPEDKKNTPESTELLPPENQPAKVGLKVFEVLEEVIAEKTNQGLHTFWNDQYRLSRNMPWKSANKKIPLLSANLMFTHRQRTVNTLTDNSPTFNLAKIGAVAAEKDQVFQDLMRTAEHWWRETEQQSFFATSVNNGELYGPAIEKLVFNHELEHGIGEVETINIDPYHFGFYPANAKSTQKAEANLHFYPMAVREAKRRWPKKADEIKSDADLLKQIGDNRDDVGGQKSATDGAMQRCMKAIANFFGSAQDQTTTDSMVMICEIWVKDRTEESVEVEQKKEGSEETEVVKVSRPKYTGFIRRVTACSGGTVVLSDDNNPNINPTIDQEEAMSTYLYDKFPFTLATSIEDSVSAWGQSDGEQLEGLQKEFAKTLSQFSYYKDKAVRPKIINPKDSGLDNSQFTNAYGVLNPSSASVAQGISYLEMNNNALMSEISGALKLIQDLFFLVSGTFELEQAQTGNVTAYKAIAALLEHAATMMRGKIRSYQMLIRERGRMYLSHVQNFYAEERWITFEDEGQDQTIAIRGQDMIVPAKLTVVSGSTLPRAEMQRREEAIALADKQMIDQEELLRVLDWPNRAAVLKRMKQGPIAEMAERLKAAGFPDELLQFFVELASMDSKEFQKAVEKGEIPQLNIPDGGPVDEGQLMQNLVQRSKVREAVADADLAEEKVITERVEQTVKQAGIAFDAEALRQKQKEDRAKFVSAQTNRPGFNERGMVSDNVEE